MHKLGGIKPASEVGLSGPGLVVWAACPSCGTERWKRRSTEGTLCVPCAARSRATRRDDLTYFGQGQPKKGDVAQCHVLGYSGYYRLYYVPCVKCGKLHWVRRNAKKTHCCRCAPKNTEPRRDRNANARYISRPDGYVYVFVEKDDPMRVMARRDGWILEHRLVVARKVGRPLKSSEHVHHVNGVRDDNRDNNLQLLTAQTHHSHLVRLDLQERVRQLEARVLLLEAENIKLVAQLEGMPIPSQAEDDRSSGVCRDLTGDTLELKGEEKVHSPRKLGGDSA